MPAFPRMGPSSILGAIGALVLGAPVLGALAGAVEVMLPLISQVQLAFGLVRGPSQDSTYVARLPQPLTPCVRSSIWRYLRLLAGQLRSNDALRVS